jgi:hypothetical protein
MKSTKIFLAAVTVFAALSVDAADFKVIANESIKSSQISAEDLKQVFLLAKTSLSDGSHAEPVLAKSGAAHEAFLKEYIGKTDAALNTYYRSLVFTGKASMPKVLASDADVAAYVAKTKGAIGYVNADADAPGTKTCEVK